MSTAAVQRWVLAFFGRIPMGTTEALVLIVTGGGAVLAAVALQPKADDPSWVVVLWWIVVIAGGILVVRSLIALLSSVFAVVGGALQRAPVEIRSPFVRRFPTPPRPVAELGVLDFEQAANVASDLLSSILNAMAKDMNQSTTLMQRYGPRFEAAATAPTIEKIRLSREFARKMDPIVSRMERREIEYRTAAHQLVANYLPRIRGFPPETDLEPVRVTMDSLRGTVLEGRTSMVGYAKSAAGVRKHNLEQSQNAIWDRIVEVANRLLEDYITIIGMTDEALKEIDGRRPKSPPTRRPRQRTRSSETPR